MKLLEVCEDVFQYVCRLNRSARKGAPLEPTMVRSDIKALLSKARSKAAQDPLLAQQFEKVERPLVYFIDFTVEESSLPFAGEWKSRRLQNEMYSVNDGDEHFFDLLDETLRDTSPQATDRLSVFFSCLGLGFTGFYQGQPEYLRRKMMEMNARLRETVDMDLRTRVVPEAYENVDQSDLIQPPARSLIGLLIAVVAVIVSIFATSVVLYAKQTEQMRRAIQGTEERLVGNTTE
ncbi:MAG: DotU family type IV/VI secretion system protein [Phycisphaeraceae bacterium]|nr:MAG: DotU family type IV/VI secretion system protein [Phycisphaeraceae bacterium]